MNPFHVFLISLLALSLIVLWLSVVRVSEGTVKIVERFGKYHRTLHPGINFIVPGLDQVRRNIQLYTLHMEGKERKPLAAPNGAISTAEEILDPGTFRAIARDNAVVSPDLVCYFRLIEPAKSVYRIGNLCDAMHQLMETTLRQEIGKLDSDELIVSREVIGANLQRALESASEAWGVKILRVEIQELNFSTDVQQNLTKAREAELSRRANVVTAQQERDTEILVAEGKKRAAVLLAEGEYEAAKLRAEAEFLLASRRLQGEAEGTRALAEAIRHNPEVIVALKALEAQKSVAESLGKARGSLIVPSEIAGLVGILGAVKNSVAFMASAQPPATANAGEASHSDEPMPLIVTKVRANGVEIEKQ